MPALTCLSAIPSQRSYARLKLRWELPVVMPTFRLCFPSFDSPCFSLISTAQKGKELSRRGSWLPCSEPKSICGCTESPGLTLLCSTGLSRWWSPRQGSALCWYTWLPSLKPLPLHVKSPFP